MTRFLATLAAVALGASALATEIPDPANSWYVIEGAAIGASIYVVPDGSGRPLTEAYAEGGNVVDATITVYLLDIWGDPVPDYPAEDIWIATVDGGLVACPGGATADAPTDAFGETHFQDPLEAGGWSATEAVQVFVAGLPLVGAPLELRLNSADIDGDLEVDLTDIVLFAQTLGDYDYAVDYNYDGAVDLADIVRLVPAIGADCD
jgi:hypothetical protein